jgi:predicted NBD/HSP70 family sugar kinase
MARPRSAAVPAGNVRRIADVLRRLGPATRAEVAVRTGLSRATVSAALGQLLDSELAVEAGPAPGPGAPGGGRPPAMVRLGPRAGLAVGVDIGNRHLRVAVADLGHEVLTVVNEQHSAGRPATQVLDRAADMVRESLLGLGFDLRCVVGVGMGLPAPLGRTEAMLAESNLLPAWAGVAPGPELADRLGCPVSVDNDANLGALAEYLWGAGRGASTIAYLKAATGIGGGLVINGELFRGVTGTAGEIGHVTLDERGDVCRCGNRGCLELVAGGAALVASLRRTSHRVETLAELIRLGVQGDPGCRRILADAGSHIGVALGSLVNLVNPEAIVIGGELGQADELLLDPMRRALRRAAIGPAVDAARVVPAELGDRSEVLGAVAVVLREHAGVT